MTEVRGSKFARVAKPAAIVSMVVIAVALLATVVLLGISRRAVPAAEPRPAATYEEARARIEKLKTRDGAEIIRPTIFLDRGSRTATAAVLFHGFTNNPEQFERIGQAYFDAGYNVLIPRLPAHGERNLMTEDISTLTAAELAVLANEAIDIAAGLGDKVEVVGLSGGGNLAALVAQDRDEVSDAVIISPLFGVDLMPAVLTYPVVAWSRALPDFYFWWDPLKKQDHEPRDAYPRYSLKSISAFFEVAFDFMRRPPSRKSELERVVVVTNAADSSVDEALARESVARELGPLAREFDEYEYPKRLGYAHDLIDPDGVNAPKIEAIYAKLLPYLGLESTARHALASQQVNRSAGCVPRGRLSDSLDGLRLGGRGPVDLLGDCPGDAHQQQPEVLDIARVALGYQCDGIADTSEGDIAREVSSVFDVRRSLARLVLAQLGHKLIVTDLHPGQETATARSLLERVPQAGVVRGGHVRASEHHRPLQVLPLFRAE